MHWHDLTATCERAQRACEETSAIRQALNATRAEMAAILAQARQLSPLGPCIDDAPPTPLARVEQATEHEVAMEVLRIMRALLEGFPPQMQIKIVKALTARTMVVVADRLAAQEAITLSA